MRSQREGQLSIPLLTLTMMPGALPDFALMALSVSTLADGNWRLTVHRRTCDRRAEGQQRVDFCRPAGIRWATASTASGRSEV